MIKSKTKTRTQRLNLNKKEIQVERRADRFMRKYSACCLYLSGMEKVFAYSVDINVC